MTSVELHVITDAADRLATATVTKTPCAPVRDLIGRDDIDAAYRIQSLNIEGLVASGQRVVGRKIGLTSPSVQQQLGVDQPDFGVLLDDMDCTGDAEVDSGRLLQPRIEAEVAFTLSRDITAPITVDDAPGYVADVYASFEIVDSRIVNWDISLADTVADNASSGLYVLGDRIDRADAPDLAAIEMSMTENDTEVSKGKGADCLGSPWHALVWLANTALAYGTGLRAGDVVLSGALGPMVPVIPGATYTATMSGLGSVTAVFSA
ncbi:2-keto-4-pentenoate hydratase [Williamsia limnetica]|nr:fumarylacetoacetate hydrolase family protein [Williamsia limnetica]